MASSNHSSDPKLLPVPYTSRSTADIEHQRREWVSGTRGGGKVPRTFTWSTNPKQMQEENGSGELTRPVSK